MSLDRFWATTGDARLRPPGRYADPGELADGGAAGLAECRRARRRRGPDGAAGGALSGDDRGDQGVDDTASVAFRGNRYSVAPGLGGIELTLRHRLGTGTVEIFPPAGR